MYLYFEVRYTCKSKLKFNKSELLFNNTRFCGQRLADMPVAKLYLLMTSALIPGANVYNFRSPMPSIELFDFFATNGKSRSHKVSVTLAGKKK